MKTVNSTSLDLLEENSQILKKSNLQFQKIFDSLLEGIQVIDFDWRYVFVNNIVKGHAKRENDDYLGKTMMEMFPGIDQTEIFKVIQLSMIDPGLKHLKSF